LHSGIIGAGQSAQRDGFGQWELVFIRSGEAEVIAESSSHVLRAGQLLIHRPCNAYALTACCLESAHVFVAAFVCNSPAMRRLRDRCFSLTPAQRSLTARLITESALVFGPLAGLNRQRSPMPRIGSPRGGQQLVGLYLAQLLLALLQKPSPPPYHSPRPAMDESFLPLYMRTRELMSATLDGSLRFTQVCRAVGLSATVFKERFQRHTGLTVMDYYRRLRIEEARRRLREGNCNIAQIADELGYSSAAAFSRQFRQVMRITPSEYLRSVRGAQDIAVQPSKADALQSISTAPDRYGG
jgi:AraC-like DNA-binding protein